MGMKKKAVQPVNSKTINYAKRRRDALLMRAGRYTYQQIADKHYNGNKGHAYKDMQKAIKDIPAEAAEMVRAQEIELLDVMARGVLPRALDGDDKAVRSMLTIMERRAKYLGLDTPVQVEQLGGGVVNVLFDPALQVTGMDDAEIVVDPK